jgi:hypothetical protein
LNASEQYAKYRAKGSKDDKNEEKKWPDHLEQAFFRGKSLGSLLQARQLTDAAL